MTRSDGRVLLFWFFAVADAQNGNLAPLIKLLCSDFGLRQHQPPSQEVWLRWQSVHAAEQTGRKMLAALLERRRLTKHRGGQRTPLFRLSEKDRLARAATLVQRFQRGEAIPTADLVRRLQRQRQGMKVAGPKRMSQDVAITAAAEMYDIDPQTLQNFVFGKIGFGRGAKPKG